MTVSNSLLNRGLALAIAVLAACVFAGCQLAQIEQSRQEPVFFPPPPEMPRLQFLKSISGPEDLGAAEPSGFQRFVLGDAETEPGISKPYGMDIFDGKLYVCDVGRRMVAVFDLKNRTFGYMTKDRRLMNPVNIHIADDGTKYVADPTAGGILIFDRDDKLVAILGKELAIAPIDVTVRGRRCYVSDFNSNQVVVFDVNTQQEIARIGEEGASQTIGEASVSELPPGQILLISDLFLDQRGSIYVTDKAAARITQFSQSGRLQRVIGRLGDNIDEFVRPKGIAVDRDQRIWVIDAASEVAKIYDERARLLLFFGLGGNDPGMMNLPATIVVDYDNVEYFEQYAVEGADIEFLVLVSNQYGPNKISVYGFGRFPVQGRAMAAGGQSTLTPGSAQDLRAPGDRGPARSPVQPSEPERTVTSREEIARLYKRSEDLYRSGQFEKAKEGYETVLRSGLIPPAMAKTIESRLAEINKRGARNRQNEAIAAVFYRSVNAYRQGRLEEARKGFVIVLNSGLIPPAMRKTIENYLAEIDDALIRRGGIEP
jgi:sugar lactone lactonase YvrE